MLTNNLKLYAILAIGALVLAAAGISGAKVGQWRAESGFATERSDSALRETALRQENADLRLAVEKQNAAVALLESEAEGIKYAKEQAEQHAAELAAYSKSRMDKLDKAMADLKTAGDVLAKFWELRQ